MAFLGDLVVGLKADVKNFDKAEKRLDRFTKRVQKSTSSLQRHSESMMRIGMYTSMFITLPILGAGAATLAFQKRFGATMNRMENLLGNSGEQVDRWKGKIMDLAPETGQGPFAIARSLEIVQQEGIKAENSMALVEQAAKAASVTGVRSMSRMTQAIANVKQALDVSAESAASFVTKMVGEEGMQRTFRISTMIGEISSNANSLGVSLSELGGVLGTVSDQGRMSWRIASDLNSVFSDLLGSTDDYMGTVKNLRSVLRDEGLKSFLESIERLEGTVAFEEIFSKSSMKILRNLTNNMDQVTKSMKRFGKNGRTMQELLQGASDTVQLQFKKAIATLESTFVELGNTLKHPTIMLLKDLNSALQDAIGWFKSLTESEIEFYLSLLKVAAAIGPVLASLGILGSIISQIGRLLVTVRKGFAYFSVIFKSSFLGPISMGITLLTTIIVHFEDFIGMLRRLLGIQKDNAEQFKKSSKLAREYGEAMDAAGGVAKQATKDLREQRASIDVLETSLRNVSEAIKETEQEQKSSIPRTKRHKTLTRELARLEERRKNIISKINAKFGDYLDNEIKAGQAYEEIASQLDKVNKRLKERIKIKATEKAREELMKRMVNLQMKIQENEDDIRQAKLKNNKAAGQQYGIMKRINSINKTIMKDLRGQYMNLGKMLDEMSDKINDVKDGKDDKDGKDGILGVGGAAEDTMGPLEILRQKLEMIRIKNESMGISFDHVKAKMNAYKQAIDGYSEKLAKQEDVTDAQRKQLDKLVSKYSSLKIESEGLKNTIGSVNEALYDSTRRVIGVGEKMNLNIEKRKQAIKKEILALSQRTALTKQESERLEDLINKYERLQDTQYGIKGKGFGTDFTVENLKSVQNALINTADKMPVMSDAASKASRIVSDAFKGMQNSISDALKNSENIFEAFGKFFKDFIQGLIIKLISAAVGTLLLATALQTLGLAPKAGPGPGVSTGFIGSLKKATEMMNTTGLFNMFGAQFASGGTVPYTGNYLVGEEGPEIVKMPGGAEVIPNNQIDENKFGTKHVVVTGRIAGEDIYLSSENYKRKKSNTL